MIDCNITDKFKEICLQIEDIRQHFACESQSNFFAGALDSLKFNLNELGATLEAECRKLQILVENAPSAMAMIDRDGIFLYINPKFKEMFGYDLKDIPCGREWFRRAYPDPAYRHPVISVWINDLKGSLPGEKRPRVFTVKCKDGTEKIIKFVAVQREDGSNIISCDDLTEAKRAELAVQQSEKRYELLFQSSPIGVFLFNTNLRITDFNDRFITILQSRRENLQDLDMNELKDQSVLPALLSVLNGVDGFYEGAYRATTSSAEIWISMRTSPLFDSCGNVIGGMGIVEDITERKQAEEALRKSEQEKAAILGGLKNVSVKYLDSRMRIIWVNKAIQEHLGLSEDEMRGKNCHEIIYGLKTPCSGCTALQALRTGESQEGEFITSDGKAWLSRSNPVKSPEGEIKGVVHVAVNITYRKRAEAALRESEERYHNMVEQASESIILFDGDTKYLLEANTAFCEMLGYTAEDLPMLSIYDIVSHDRESIDANIQKVLAKGRHFVGERRYSCKDGSLVDVEVSANLILHGGRKTICTMARDITERKRAEEKIMESERRLADIINFLPDATFVIDKEGKVIAWNRTIEAMTGIKAEEILGKGDYEYALPFYGERRPILIDLVLCPQKEIEKEYTDLKRQDGNLVGGAYMPTLKGGGIFLVGSAAALYDSEGNVSGAIESIRDITENKHAEEALQRAKDEAELAMRAKSEFLANMSHEIRTPLNAVVGMTGLLLDSDLEPDQREGVEIIYSSGDALLATINNILDYSKIEEGKGELERQPFNLRECIESSLDLVTSMAAEKGLRLTCEVDDSVPENLIGDVTRLRQVMVNLLSNAVKFTETGWVSIKATSQLKDGRHEISFTVRDTGIGIPSERMDRLFKSFSQVDMSTTRRYGGTGLGLAISKRLVEMMGGEIWVESEAGKGSAFHFSIVADSAPASRPASSRVSPSGAAERACAPASMRLLLAEDNLVNQKVVQRMLRKIGYRADVAANGIEVLKAVERQLYDLILMDVQMPEMDGLEATRAIRKLPQERQPKIVAITAYALEGDREKCLEAGMDDYISKPVQMGELAEMLSKYKPLQMDS